MVILNALKPVVWLSCLAKPFFYRIEQIACNIKVKGPVELADTSGAGDIDFGHIVADHIDAGEYDSALF